MVMETYPVGQVWDGAVIYDNTQVDKLMSAFATCQATGQNDTNPAITTDMATTVNVLIVTFIYSKPSRETGVL